MNNLTKEQQLEQQLVATKVSLADITMSLQHSQKQVSALQEAAVSQEQIIEDLTAEIKALKEKIADSAGKSEDPKAAKDPKQ